MSELKDNLNEMLLIKKQKIIPKNIKKGVEIFGVEGNFEGEILYNALISPEVSTNKTFSLTSSLTKIGKLNVQGKTSLASAFNTYTNLERVEEIINTSEVTAVNTMFRNCSRLLEVPKIDTQKVTQFNFFAYGCVALQNVPQLNANKATSVTQMFENCSALEYFGGLLNLGKSFNVASNNYSAYTLDLSTCRKLTNESLINVINGIYDLNLTFNVAGGKPLYTQSLILGATNLSKLTAEEIRNSNSKAVGPLVNNKKEEIKMKFFNYTKPKMIVAEEGKQIRNKNDVYVAEHIDEEGNIIPEHFPYYSTTVFVPDSYTEEQMNEEYIEESIDND